MIDRTLFRPGRMAGWSMVLLPLLVARPGDCQIDTYVGPPVPSDTTPQAAPTYNVLPPSQPLLAIDDKTYQFNVPPQGLLFKGLDVGILKRYLRNLPPKQVFTLGGAINGNGNSTVGATRLVYSSGVSQFDLNATRLFGPVDGIQVGGTLLLSSSRRKYADGLRELRAHLEALVDPRDNAADKKPSLPSEGLGRAYEDSLARMRYATRVNYTRFNGLGDVTTLGLSASYLYVLDQRLKRTETRLRAPNARSAAIGGLVDIAAVNANPKLAGSTWTPDWQGTVYWQDRAPLSRDIPFKAGQLDLRETRIERWRVRVGATYRGDNRIAAGDSITGFVRIHDGHRNRDFTLSGGKGPDGRAIVGFGIDIGFR